MHVSARVGGSPASLFSCWFSCLNKKKKKLAGRKRGLMRGWKIITDGMRQDPAAQGATNRTTEKINPLFLSVCRCVPVPLVPSCCRCCWCLSSLLLLLFTLSLISTHRTWITLLCDLTLLVLIFFFLSSFTFVHLCSVVLSEKETCVGRGSEAAPTQTQQVPRWRDFFSFSNVLYIFVHYLLPNSVLLTSAFVNKPQWFGNSL